MTRPLKIFCTYHTVDKPWGGANNFLRALKIELSKNHPVVFVQTPDADTDVIFMNEMSKGPAQDSGQYTFQDIANFRKTAPRAKFVVRVVNLKSHAYAQPLWKYTLSGQAYSDYKTLKLMKMAGKIIFQSRYQYGVFNARGFRGKNYSIIHNGAAADFSVDYTAPEFSEHTPLKFLATSFSKSKGKKQAKIAALSTLPMTEVYFAGQWPEDTDPKNIKLLGVLTHDQIREILKTVHYIIHPSERDVCPNSLIEGLRMGVPALYNPGAGSGPELAADYGLPWNAGNLEAIATQARLNYDPLRNKLSANRAYFSIARAAAAYYEVFKHDT